MHPHGYVEYSFILGLWKHATRDITFCLVVDDFRIKYTNKDDLNHLLTALQQHKPENVPHIHNVSQYGAKVQYTNDANNFSALDAKEKKRIQEILGTLLYCTRAVD